MADQIDGLIKFYGGKANLARALDISPQRVHNWSVRGIPGRYAIKIEELTGGRFKARELVNKPVSAA